MARIGIELPGELIELIDRQAEKDGHGNRCAVIRKSLNAFFAGSPGGGADVVQRTVTQTDTVAVGIELPDQLIELIDRQAEKDGHSIRSAVVRKALNYFFAR